MTSAPQKTVLAKILAAFSRFLWEAISLLVPLLTFTFIFGLVAVELIPLGPSSRFLAFIVPAIAVVAALLMKTLPSVSAGKLRRGGRARFGLRLYSRERIALFALMSMFLIAAAVIIPTTIERLSRTDDARIALRSFTLIRHPAVDIHNLERTLAELERARRSFSEEWMIPDDAPPITLQLFPDIESYRQIRDERWSTGFVRCKGGGVTIVVPVEKTAGMLDEYSHSGTPTHEMAHAMMCQTLGQEGFFSIQLWFHEGMAQFYQNQNLTKLFDRAFNRTSVWLKRDSLPPPDRFCDYQLDGTGSEIALFYQDVLGVRPLPGIGLRETNPSPPSSKTYPRASSSIPA